MEVSSNGIRIKHDGDNGYVILSKRGSEDTRHVSERKQCGTCEHLRKAVVVKETLFDEEPGTSPEPVGVCTLGITWSVIIGKPLPARLGCGRMAMGLEDTYHKHIKEE